MLEAAPLVIFSHEERGIWRLSDGRKVFIKISGSTRHDVFQVARRALIREQTCLEVLKGLAVPELVRLRPREHAQLLGKRKVAYLAQCAVGLKPIESLGLEPTELLGVWVFIAEQLVAFRRHYILYSDVKCSNVVGQEKPLRVTLVDFGCAVPLTKGKRFPNHGVTPSYAAPETIADWKMTEHGLVYQLGMLLAHLLTGLDNSTLRHPKKGLSRVTRILNRAESPALSRLLGQCLKTNPLHRPANYEHVLEMIRMAGVSEGVQEIWTRLRAPYLKRLAEVGL